MSISARQKMLMLSPCVWHFKARNWTITVVYFGPYRDRDAMLTLLYPGWLLTYSYATSVGGAMRTTKHRSCVTSAPN